MFKQRCHTQQCDINPKGDYLKFSNFKLQKATNPNNELIKEFMERDFSIKFYEMSRRVG